jgi:uncharacterized protein
MTIERRFVKGAHVRAKGGDKPGIEGYAAVFNEQYVLYDGGSFRVVELIKPGAFARVLREKQDTRCLFNHDPDNVLGRTTNSTLRISQDKDGLPFENDLDLRTTVGQNVQAFIDRGDVTGCSFAFTVATQVWREEKTADGVTISTREIEEIESLFDVGPVTYPAYEGTSVSPRGAAELMEARSRVLAIDGLPAEVRSQIEKAGKKKKDDAKCDCRCVACARDKDCSTCADHMVDCGDETNCRCMDSRSARGTVGGGNDCECSCPECQVGDCENCSAQACDDKNCDHTGGDDDRSAALLHIEDRLRQVR